MKWARVLFTAAAVVSLVVALRVPPTSAQMSSPFTLAARADSIGAEIYAAGAPLDANLAFVTPSSAQASFDSIGASNAYASAPNVGDFVASLPALANGLGAGSIPPVPQLPFYATTEHPTTPTAHQELGPYLIDAASDENGSRAESRIGLSTASPEVVSASSQVNVSQDPATGLLTATATTQIDPFNLAGLLQIGSITSSTTLRWSPDDPEEPVAKETSTSIGTLSIAGLTFGLTDQGLVLGGSLLPLDLSLIEDLLAGSGFVLEYVPAHETETSITSAAVRLTYSTVVPSLGESRVTLVLGQSSATLDPTAGQGPGAVPDVVIPVVPGSPTPAGVARPPTGSAGGGVVVSPTGPAAGRQPATNPSGGAATGAAQPISAPLPMPDMIRFYPVLAFAALAAVAGSRTERLQWLRQQLPALRARPTPEATS